MLPKNKTSLDNSDRYLYLSDYYTAENTPLASGESYTVTQNISIPNSVAPGRYLLFVADRGGMFGNNQGETNEDNNIQAVAISLYAQDQIFNGTLRSTLDLSVG